MNESVVKITRRQLRRLVENTLLREFELVRGTWNSPDTRKSLRGFVDEIHDVWLSDYHEDDPSQSAAGKENWQQEVDSAANEFEQHILMRWKRVEAQLYDGGYLKGRV